MDLWRFLHRKEGPLHLQEDRQCTSREAVGQHLAPGWSDTMGAVGQHLIFMMLPTGPIAPNHPGMCTHHSAQV